MDCSQSTKTFGGFEPVGGWFRLFRPTTTAPAEILGWHRQNFSRSRGPDIQPGQGKEVLRHCFILTTSESCNSNPVISNFYYCLLTVLKNENKVKLEGWVMGGDSRPRSRGFESRYRILDGHFITYIVKIVMFVWKDQKYTIKEAGDYPVFKKNKNGKNPIKKSYGWLSFSIIN